MSMGIENSRVIEVMAMLAAKWPACFSIYEGRRRPLRIGIHHDVEAALGDSVNPGELHAALHRYTKNTVYLSRCIAGAGRIDLAGEVAGNVTAHEARMATETLRRRGAKVQVSDAPAPAQSLDVTVSAAPAKMRLSLSDLKAAALARRRASSAAA